MRFPLRDELIRTVASKPSRIAAFATAAIGGVWIWIDKLFEHIMLQWVAEHLVASPMLNWAIEHPFQLFMTLGLSYCLIVILVALRKPKKQGTLIPASIPPESTQEAMPPVEHLEARVETHAPNSPATSIQHVAGDVHVTGVPSMPPSTPSARPTPLRPNLIYRGARNTNVVFQWPSEGIREPRNREEREGAIKAVVLKFENDVRIEGNGGVEVTNVIGRILYRSTCGAERGIDYAAWLDAPIRIESLDVGDTRELVLLMLNSRDEIYAADDRRRDGFGNFPGISWLRVEPIINLQSAKVTLVANSHARYDFEFSVSRDEKDFRVELINPKPLGLQG